MMVAAEKAGGFDGRQGMGLLSADDRVSKTGFRALLADMQARGWHPLKASLPRFPFASGGPGDFHACADSIHQHVLSVDWPSSVAGLTVAHPSMQQPRGKHYKFERYVEELGGFKQMYMLAGTPSSQRYIRTVRAAMARADRKVAELKAAAAAVAPPA